MGLEHVGLDQTALDKLGIDQSAIHRQNVTCIPFELFTCTFMLNLHKIVL